MDFQVIILLGILTSTLGGLLHGVTNFNYGRIASYSSPSIIANPSVAATYSTSRYTAYSLVPVAAPTLVRRQPVGGGFVRAFAAPSFSKHSGFSNSLLRHHQGVTAYAAVPIAGYRAHFGSPSIRNFGTSSHSFRNFPADALSLHQSGLYPPPAPGLDDFNPTIVNDQSNYGNFNNENQISIW